MALLKKALALTLPAIESGGATTLTTTPFRLWDEGEVGGAAVCFDAGTLTGTSAALQVTLQGQGPEDSTSGTWYDLATASVTTGNGVNFQVPEDAQVPAKLRLQIVKANADNATSTATAKVFSNANSSQP